MCGSSAAAAVQDVVEKDDLACVWGMRPLEVPALGCECQHHHKPRSGNTTMCARVSDHGNFEILQERNGRPARKSYRVSSGHSVSKLTAGHTPCSDALLSARALEKTCDHLYLCNAIGSALSKIADTTGRRLHLPQPARSPSSSPGFRSMYQKDAMPR